MDKHKLFAVTEAQGLGLTYGDLTLDTDYSDILPSDVSIETRFSRNVPLKCGIVSAAMDTITEYRMAIIMARFGGLGIIHKGKGMTSEAQAAQVRRVKLCVNLNGRIDNPIHVKDTQTMAEVMAMRNEKQYEFHSFPVIHAANGKLVGLLTGKHFDRNDDPDRLVGDVMKPFKELVVGAPNTTMQEAYEHMSKTDTSVLPLVNAEQQLTGMYAYEDVRQRLRDDTSTLNVDARGHLRVGVAVGAPDASKLDTELQRVILLDTAGADVFVIDTAHGDSKNVFDTFKAMRNITKKDIVVGNISKGHSAKRLAYLGVDGIKVGQGPGSICTTRDVAGVGFPQASAIYECAVAIHGSGIPICADGGIVVSGDVAKAFGMADSVMVGGYLAATDRTPGEIKETAKGKFKSYRGMGSLSAMNDSVAARERYRQGNLEPGKRLAEGVEKDVRYRGNTVDKLNELINGLRLGMAYVGAHTIEEMHAKANFSRMTPAGKEESKPHDVDETNSGN